MAVSIIYLIIILVILKKVLKDKKKTVIVMPVANEESTMEKAACGTDSSKAAKQGKSFQAEDRLPGAAKDAGFETKVKREIYACSTL